MMADNGDVVSTIIIRSDGTVKISNLTPASLAEIEAGLVKALDFVKGHKANG